MNMATHNPMDGEQQVEQAIQAAGKTAPRVTPTDIDAAIESEHFFTAANGVFGTRRHDGRHPSIPEPLDLLTFCVLVLRNGFTVTGESACASPENFDAQIGRDVARKNAREKIWPLMGFALKDKLAAAEKPVTHLDARGFAKK